ncbi:MAG: hypothetical protein ACRDVG_05100, partial [Jatrophihabitantaceae bacterium]
MSGVEFAPPQSSPPQQPADQLPPPATERVPGPKPRRRRGLGARSLTARLIIGVVSLVLVLVALIGGGTWYSLRYFLSQRLDQQLQSTVSNASLRSILSDQYRYGPLPPPTGV